MNKDTPSVEQVRAGGHHRSESGGRHLNQIAAILEVDPSYFRETRAPHALPENSEELRANTATLEARSIISALAQIDNPLLRRHLLRLIYVIAGKPK